ncbi:hypothetical protein AVEN_12296-1 [Araneus ventricosus]|uniref:Endonuclease/exonuclease/phosphatase domain-containing protein n=1 Tax=Araneus ventricosus TaxID=182803 RepID=A0A4Y2E864_ARAVE|nr:hypothetical protein AVEN_12296-1 [Araneus ventricosus]
MLAIKVNTEELSFYIINIYAPTGFDNDIIRTFLDALTELSFIFGDFNLHHPLWGSNDSSRFGNKFANWLMDSNFVILNTSTPTHTSPAGKQSLFDLTLCSKSLLYHSDCFVVDSSFESDHSPVVTTCTLFQHNQRYRTEIKWQSIMILAEKSFEDKGQDLESIPHQVSSIISQNTRKFPLPDKQYPPWWNNICHKLHNLKIIYRKKALSTFSSKFWILHKKICK